MSMRAHRWGMTLVELLVVVALIALLLAMIFPAVQKVREYANRLECTNHLKTIGKGVQLYRSAHQNYFPSGGANLRDVLDNDNGRVLTAGGVPLGGEGQKMGWMFQILPYVEHEALWSLRRGTSETKNDPITGLTYHLDDAADHEIRKTPMPLYLCPSRRGPQLLRASDPSHYVHMISDYAGNGGPLTFVTNLPLSNFELECCATSPAGMSMRGVIISTSQAPRLSFMTLLNKKRIHERDILDGVTHTLLAGEKAWSHDRGLEAQWGDNRSWCAGFGPSTVRTGQLAPRRDFNAQQEFEAGTPMASATLDGYELIQDGFGSAHPLSFNALFADGSVRTIKYGVNEVRKPVVIWNPLMAQFGINPLPSPPNFPNSLALTYFQRLCDRADGTLLNLLELDD